MQLIKKVQSIASTDCGEHKYWNPALSPEPHYQWIAPVCTPSTGERVLSYTGSNTMNLLEICKASSVWCAEEGAKEMTQSWENALVQKSDSSCLNTEVSNAGSDMRGSQHRVPWLLLERNRNSVRDIYPVWFKDSLWYEMNFTVEGLISLSWLQGDGD